MKMFRLLFFLFMVPRVILAQFQNHQWLIGNQWLQTVPKGRMIFDTSSYQYQVELRKMAFNDTQGNICNSNGDFLMSSNGVWIANANNDTMMNGSGMNPGPYVNTFPNGLYIPKANIFLPYPGDSLKYLLFHHSGSPNITNVPSLELFYSVIDMRQDNGLGGVDSSSKNVLVFQDTISWGITACKHANGRDWWIVAVKDGSPVVHICLYSESGIIYNTTQIIGSFINGYGNVCNPSFSLAGDKFAFTIFDDSISRNSSVIVSDFDRCNGVFSNSQIIPVTNGSYLWGLSFSSSGNIVYTNSSVFIFQIELATLSIDTVAVYDGFSYPIPSAATTFSNEYLAANGKIYLTAGGGAQHLHEMNFPDSVGVSCDVQQHAVSLGVWNLRSVPNHPNYNLGPVVGSVCDTLGVGIPELAHDFHFSIAPNPVSGGWIKLMYLLPQNNAGNLEVYSLTGQKVYSQTLPPWSTLQFIHLPNLEAGIYTAVIMSGRERSAKKLVVMK